MKQQRDLYNLLSVIFAASSNAITSAASLMDKFIHSINGCDISSQQTGALGIKHAKEVSVTATRKRLLIRLHK